MIPISLQNLYKLVTFTTETAHMVCRAKGEEEWKPSGYEFAFRKVEPLLKRDVADGSGLIGVYFIPFNFSLKGNYLNCELYFLHILPQSQIF